MFRPGSASALKKSARLAALDQKHGLYAERRNWRISTDH